MKKHIALVGCGNWGRYILRDLKSLDCNVTVVARSQFSILNAKEYKADTIVDSIQDIDGELIDGSIVASPTATHFTVIQQLLAFGKPVFTEKPMTNSLQSAQELVTMHSDLLFVMDKWKYHSGIIKIKQMIESDDFGKVKQIVLRRNQWSSPHKDVDPVWILIPHDISIAQYLLDQTPEPLFVTANKTKDDYFTSMHATLEAQDTHIIIEVAGDAVATERSVRIVCEKASFALPSSNAEHILLFHHTDAYSALPESLPISPNMPLYDELKTFLEFISDSSTKLHSTAQQGLENIQLIHQLRHLAQG